MKLELQQQDQTEIYASDAGYVCIRQITAFGDNDPLVCVRPDDIARLIRHLRLARDVAFQFRDDHNKSQEAENA